MDGLQIVFSWQVLLFIILGLVVGVILGAVPGVSGALGIA